MIRLLALTLLLTGHAVAQTPTVASCTDPACRAFDFWLGEWLVDDPAGTKQGDNSITSEEGGCLIVERWTSASGGSGQSYNFFDPGSRQWRQVWVSQGAVIDYAGGPNSAGDMELQGSIRYRDGRSAPFRGLWSKLSDGSVKQQFDEFDLAQQKWTSWFTGIYRRKS
jgi:hypothetical protein